MFSSHLTSGCFQPNIASKDCGKWFTSIAKSCHQIGGTLCTINSEVTPDKWCLGDSFFFAKAYFHWLQGNPLRFLFHVFSAPIDAGIILHEISSSHPRSWWLSTDSVTIFPSKQRAWIIPGSLHHHTRPFPQFEAPNHTSGSNRWRTAVPFSYGPKTFFLEDFSKVRGLNDLAP